MEDDGRRVVVPLGRIRRECIPPLVGAAVAAVLACWVLSPTISPLPPETTTSTTATATSTETLTHTTTTATTSTTSTTTTTTEPPAAFIKWLGAPARLWQTALGSDDRLTQKPDVLMRPDFDYIGTTVDVTDHKGQKIVGFGGAFTESSALVFHRMSKQNQKRFLDALFGPDGIGYTLGRVHINSCDFSEDHYSYDDHANDLTLKHFDDNATHDSKALIPLIRLAQELLESQGKSLKLLATPWSPPAWMKTNGQMDHSSRPCLRKEAHRTWAKYISRWITAVQSKRVPIWGITVQNEPEYNATWEACLMTPHQEADFVGTHLGPVLQEEHPNVLVFAYDHNKNHVYWWANVTYSHPVASKYVHGIAFHWYSGDGFEDIKRVHKEFPQALLLATEATYERWRWQDGSSVATGDWSFGEGYAHDIIGDLNAGSIGWIDWNLLLDETGGPNHVNNVCDAAMLADMQKDELYFHPQYYFIGHFSKFIPPGSVHLQTNVFPTYSYRGQQRKYGTCTWEDGLQVTSFLRADGFIATVVLNCGHVPIKFKLRAGHRAAEASIPAHAIQTYLFEQTGTSPLRPHSVGSLSLATGFVGVNLGGWLVLEDYMWEKEMRAQKIPDEHTLIQRYGGPNDTRALAVIEAHRESFVTEADLDKLRDFGVSHVRVPVGYWLVDFDPADGFIDGAERYLYRLLRWLQPRGMRCVIDLHALPGAQVTGQSFTGKKSDKPNFFINQAQYERGKQAMVRFAKLILRYEKDPSTAGVVMGFELVNEPAWDHWKSDNGVKQLYDDMVPVLRRYLPANRFVILLNFMESPRYEGSEYLASWRTKDPNNWQNVVYDAHIYHAYGDDQHGPKYEAKRGGIDACKTCCRDNLVLDPMVQLRVPIIIGEYSLNTGFAGNPDFYDDFLRNQLSLWATTQGVVGSFFWNHRILRNPHGWFKEMSLLELVQPEGPIVPVSKMDLSGRCPAEDLSLCPSYHPQNVTWTTQCQWRTTTSSTTTVTSSSTTTSTETETTTTGTTTTETSITATTIILNTSSARPTSTSLETAATVTRPKLGRLHGEHRHASSHARDGLRHVPGFGDLLVNDGPGAVVGND